MKEHNELQQRLATVEAERDRLKSNLLAILTALEVKEIEDLMTKSEDHFRKLGDVIKDSIVEKIMELDRLKEKNERLRNINKELRKFVKKMNLFIYNLGKVDEEVDGGKD